MSFINSRNIEEIKGFQGRYILVQHIMNSIKPACLSGARIFPVCEFKSNNRYNTLSYIVAQYALNGDTL
jgi:hypothetical protein